MSDRAHRDEAGSIGESRASFVARVRSALGDRPANPDTPDVNEGLLRTCSDTEPLAERFAAQAEAVGMCVQRVTEADLGDTLALLLKDTGTATAALSIADNGLRAVIDGVCRRCSVESDASPTQQALFDADVGITDVDAAVAESGSMVIASGPARARGGFVIPPVHIAIVPATCLVPDLIDFWRRWGSEHSPSSPAAVVLVTGPSKTADIEGVLVTGVHGPGQVYILLVEDG